MNKTQGKVNTVGLPTPKGAVSFPYTFNLSRNKDVAKTYESLSTQAINQYGLDVMWMPLAGRTDITLRDKVLGEMSRKDYRNSHYMRVMMQDIQQLKGGENIYSKFGLIIEDTLTIFITVQHFLERVGSQVVPSDAIEKLWTKTDEVYCKPEIQDILYVPMYDGFYEVNFAERFEHMAIGYSYGWMIYTKKYNYSTSDNVYIDKAQTGFGSQTGLPDDYGKVVDRINLADSNVEREVKTDVIPDATQTGFDPNASPNMDNFTAAAQAANITKPGEKDIFSNW